MYIGIDLGTSAVKVVLVDAQQRIVSVAERAFSTSRPKSGWSEQDPDTWFEAVCSTLDEISRDQATAMGRVVSIGLSGQMHGLVLLDDNDLPVCPAILWNDGRAAKEAAELNREFPHLPELLGVRAMPGFTGAKILWLSRNQPEVLAKARSLLFPKDYIRFKLNGTKATDVSDAAGSWLLDQARRSWSDEAREACAAQNISLPQLHESSEATGILNAEFGERWGLSSKVIIAAGAGDVAAGCIGIGSIEGAVGLISLGTSAQIVLATQEFAPRADALVHTFCHAQPKSWIHMAALLNGVSVLDSVRKWTGYDDVGEMIRDVERKYHGPGKLLALPYFSGERTPHNDSRIRGAIAGIDHSTTRDELALAFMEGIAFSLCDGLESLLEHGVTPNRLALVGGGSKSEFLARLIASVLNVPISLYEGADVGPALGAAHLARMAAEEVGSSRADVMPLPIANTFAPDPALHEGYAEKLQRYRAFYQAMRPEFGEPRC